MNSDLTENDNTVKAENILNKLMNPNVSISTLYANSESRIPIISLIFFVFGIAIPMYIFFFNLNIYYQITSYGYIKHTGTMNTNSCERVMDLFQNPKQEKLKNICMAS